MLPCRMGITNRRNSCQPQICSSSIIRGAVRDNVPVGRSLESRYSALGNPNLLQHIVKALLKVDYYSFGKSAELLSFPFPSFILRLVQTSGTDPCLLFICNSCPQHLHGPICWLVAETDQAVYHPCNLQNTAPTQLPLVVCMKGL